MADNPSETPFRTGGGIDVLSDISRFRLDNMEGLVLGDYRISGLIAEGGMGRVYRAERIDGSFEREVAIKISAISSISGEMRRRFQQEQNVLAGLSHPHISQLYDAQVTEEGWPYIVMELINGVPINRFCEENKLDCTARVELLVDVVDAVAFAHSRLIVHRDLKPSNILIDENDQAKLLDFGIAKLIDGTEQSVTQQRPMTPRYASPEQLLGQPVRVASDVYQLGLLIYEVIAGEPINQGTNLSDAIQAAADQRSVQPSPEQRSRLPNDIRSIVERSLHSDPDARYTSATELREDLLNYLHGFPVQAARPGALYRFRKFVRRNWIPVGIATVAVVALATSTIWYTLSVTDSRRVAEERARAAQRSRIEAEATLRLFKEVFSRASAKDRALDSITVKEVLLAGVDQVEEILPEEPRVRVPAINEFARLYYGFQMFEAAQQLISIGLEAINSGGVDPRDADQTLLIQTVILSNSRRYEEAARVLDQRWDQAQKHADAGEAWAATQLLKYLQQCGSSLSVFGRPL